MSVDLTFSFNLPDLRGNTLLLFGAIKFVAIWASQLHPFLFKEWRNFPGKATDRPLTGGVGDAEHAWLEIRKFWELVRETIWLSLVSAELEEVGAQNRCQQSSPGSRLLCAKTAETSLTSRTSSVEIVGQRGLLTGIASPLSTGIFTLSVGSWHLLRKSPGFHQHPSSSMLMFFILDISNSFMILYFLPLYILSSFSSFSLSHFPMNPVFYIICWIWGLHIVYKRITSNSILRIYSWL